jgi:hypothetical protein
MLPSPRAQIAYGTGTETRRRKQAILVKRAVAIDMRQQVFGAVGRAAHVVSHRGSWNTEANVIFQAG